MACQDISYCISPKSDKWFMIYERLIYSKAIPVRGRGGQHFQGNRLTDGGEVSHTRQAIPLT
jgi:hypothetical protein